MNWISYFLGNHPKQSLLFVIVILIPLLSYFIIYPLQIECDVRRGFANKHGRAVKEFTRFSNFYNISGLEIWGILVRNKTFGEHLEITPKILNEVSRLHVFVQNFSTTFNGEVVNFHEITHFDLNYVLNYYMKLLPLEGWIPGINLSYPVAQAFGNSFYLGSQFFGANLDKDSQEGPLHSAQFIALWYMSKAETFEEKQKLQAIQLGIFKTPQFSKMFDMDMYGDQVANSEMLRGTMTTVKLFIAGGILMITFMAFTFHDLTIKSKIMLIIGAISSPLAATAACFSLLGWIGHPFNSIMCITPFLILGIGVDDAFLLLNCWRREQEKGCSETRLARVIREIAPSMAITSLTNTMAFGVGFLSPTPQMSSFCLGTALAIVLDFIFEFLIFIPMMVLFYEEKIMDKSNEIVKKPMLTWHKYAETLLSHHGQIGGVLLYIMIIGASYYGTMTIETTFDPSKTFPSDSKLVESLQSFNMVQEEYSPMNFLTKVPDLESLEETLKFEEMLHRLETREGCFGMERSHNLYRDYISYLNSANINSSFNEKQFSYSMLPEFLKKREMADRMTIQYKIEGNETKVDILNFVVVCKGTANWGRRAIALEKTRNIIDEYPQFEVSLFDYDATIYDLIITVKSELFKSLGITFTCMTLACFVIMPSFVAPTVASIATVSISFCFVGFLSIWGQNLDPVTMIDVIMAIGFSVDYSAHVCFHYYCALRKLDTTSRTTIISHVLCAIGRPVIEASITTLLCMAPLFIVPVYIIRSFAKTVTLVTVFGLLHGLIFLPVLLSFIPIASRPLRLPTSSTTQPLVDKLNQ
ncbi:unnamed protein product [Caenorhabditis bovis]|uniref:SSD domain-containing protein n=1 Tax=Caenorhabditis bovis TaxID=2654633 RepID=A0A8S1EPV8_9PELO|nr:unnamed protein product [Caenorhabditis bovis]